jgi:uncharacterized membrane protein YfcA
MSGRLLRLGAIATAAGAFSGLFGVGGGTIIVIGVLAAAGHALYGNVDFWKGVLIAIPAVAGVVAGAAIQQRISERAVEGAFVVLLLASAAVLVF